MAEAELNRLARGFMKGRAVVQGRGDLHAGKKIKFSDMADGFTPEAFIVSSRHTNSPTEGYVTEVHFVSNTFPV